jgi:Family of unknown function (DUF6131)
MMDLENTGANPPRTSQTEDHMIVIGAVLLVLGLLTGLAILETVGVILLIVGLVLMLVGSTGRPVAGRRHYW